MGGVIVPIDWKSSPIPNIVNELGQGLQSLEEKMPAQIPSRVKIRFPRGTIRTVRHFEHRLRFLQDDVVKRNIAYTLQLTDVNQWLVNRFDIGLSAGSLFMKQATITVITIMEAILYADWSQRHPALKRIPRFAQLIDLAAREGRISPSLKIELHQVRDIRNNIHLSRVSQAEGSKYTIVQYQHVVLIQQRLIDELQNTIKHP